MELKSTLLFPRCARWHMWDSCLSLKKINAWGIFPTKESSLRASKRTCMRAFLRVGSDLTWFLLCNFSLRAQNVAWPGVGLILEMILKMAEPWPCWQDPGHVITSKRGAKLLIISLTLLLPVNRAECRLQHGSTLLLKRHCNWAIPCLYGMHLSHERRPRAAATEEHSLLYMHGRHLAAHPNFWTLPLALYLDSTRPD